MKVHAVEYLLKPFTDERLREAVSRATHVLRERQLARVGENVAALLRSLDKNAKSSVAHTSRIAIRTDGATSFVATADIDWIEAADYYSRIHAGGKKLML